MKGNRLNLTIETKLSQKLLITPQMKQSLQLLQMPITDLLTEINNILEENPILEITEEIQENEDSAKDKFLEELKKVDWEDYYSDAEEWQYLPSGTEDVNYEKFVGKTLSLEEHLTFQLKVSGLSEREEDIGFYIIGNLDERGYLSVELQDIADELNVEVEDVKSVLKKIQDFDPSGIASVDLCECILKQLEIFDLEYEDYEEIERIIRDYSVELIKKDYRKICEEMRIDYDRIDYLLSWIKKTDPKPGLRFNHETKYVVPDIYVLKGDEGYDIALNEEDFPSLKLNNYYMKLLKSEGMDDNTKNYVEDKMKNALWLLKSLNQRRKAIYKVMEAIVDFQMEFFEHGTNSLKPLKLKDISERTGLHESTVSRVTAGKYAMCEHGVVELKSFFVKGMSSDDGDISTDKIKNHIKKIIEEEPKDKSYSDQKIVEILEKRGIKIARRTVAKYREEMDIPAASDRKKIRR